VAADIGEHPEEKQYGGHHQDDRPRPAAMVHRVERDPLGAVGTGTGGSLAGHMA